MLNVRYYSVVSLGTLMSTFRLFEEFVIVGEILPYDCLFDTITAYDVEIFNDTLSPTITNS